MPELPEVETITKGLSPHLTGATIKGVETTNYRLRFPYPDGFMQSLIGRKIIGLKRRAKYIICQLDNNESIIIHLGMSGRINLVGNGHELSFENYLYKTGEKTKHDHVKLLLEKNGQEFYLIYNDPRRFGLWDITNNDTLKEYKHFAHLGPEPLSADFNGQRLIERIGKKAAPIKLALLNQEIIVGLGNIYVCEALFMSHISPLRPANSLSIKEANLLVKNIKQVLETAIEKGGSTLRDYEQANGQKGGFQNHFLVYDKENCDCTTKGCSGKIKRITQGGRSTFYCELCQK